MSAADRLQAMVGAATACPGDPRERLRAAGVLRPTLMEQLAALDVAPDHLGEGWADSPIMLDALVEVMAIIRGALVEAHPEAWCAMREAVRGILSGPAHFTKGKR